jgi:MFS transporter, OFA family, oxalate/formate antiporter
MATQASTPNRILPLIGGMILNLVLGTSYAWSAFVLPLEKQFGWTRTQTSVTFTIIILNIGFWFLVAGRLQDRMNPRPLAIFGALLYATGFFLGSMTSSLMWLYLAFGMMIGMGNGFGFCITIPVITKWFPDKRGPALGAVIAAYGLGSGVWGPLAAKLILAIGWQATFRLYGAIFFVLTLIGASLLRNPPEGYRPAGWDPAKAAATTGRAHADIPTGAMLKTPTFYFLWIAYWLGSAAGLMLISQLIPFGTKAGIANIATIGLVVGALGNMSGRFFSGWVSETFGRVNTLRLMMLVSAIAMPLLYLFSGNVAAFSVFVFVVYYCYGTLLSVFAATSADFYGTKYLGLNYGLLFTAWGVSALLGPLVGAKLYDATGSYQYAFYAGSVLSVLAIFSLFMTKTPRHEAVAATPASPQVAGAGAR